MHVCGAATRCLVIRLNLSWVSRHACVSLSSGIWLEHELVQNDSNVHKSFSALGTTCLQGKAHPCFEGMANFGSTSAQR